MNENLFDRLWTGHLEGSLDESQEAMLHQFLLENPQRLDDLVSEREIDAALNLLTNETQNEQFLQECLIAVDRHQTTPLNGATDQAVRKNLLPVHKPTFKRSFTRNRNAHEPDKSANPNLNHEVVPPPVDDSPNQPLPVSDIHPDAFSGPVIQVANNDSYLKLQKSKARTSPRKRRLKIAAVVFSSAALLATVIAGVMWQMGLNGGSIDQGSDNLANTSPSANTSSDDDNTAPNNIKPVNPTSDVVENELPENSDGDAIAQSPESQNNMDPNSQLPKRVAPNDDSGNPASIVKDGNEELEPKEGLANDSYSPDLKKPSIPETLLPKPAAPVIATTKNLRWLQRPETEDGLGVYAFKRGAADIELHDGSTIQVAGPAEVEIKADDVIFVKHGMISANVSDSSELKLETPFTEIANSKSANLQMLVGDSGVSEVLLNKGQAELRRSKTKKSTNPLEEFGNSDNVLKMDANGLNQAIAQAVDLTPQNSDKAFVPFVFMAQGANEFRGHIDINGETVTLDMQEPFAQLMRQIATSDIKNVDEFSQRWGNFVQQFDEFQVTMLNRFDSTDFDRFFEQFKQQYVQPQQGTSQNFGDGSWSTSTSFQGVIKIGDREMRFTSPEVFDRFKRENQIFTK